MSSIHCIVSNQVYLLHQLGTFLYHLPIAVCRSIVAPCVNSTSADSTSTGTAALHHRRCEYCMLPRVVCAASCRARTRWKYYKINKIYDDDRVVRCTMIYYDFVLASSSRWCTDAAYYVPYVRRYRAATLQQASDNTTVLVTYMDIGKRVVRTASDARLSVWAAPAVARGPARRLCDRSVYI